MQIVLHIGANATDRERLLKSLLKNVETFTEQGVRVPGPGRYRKLLRETIQQLSGQMPPAGTRDTLLDAMIDGDDATRLVLSHANFLAVPNQIFDGGVFYGNAEAKIASFASLFPGDELEFHIGLRNPATFIPAVFEQSVIPAMPRYLSGFEPEDLRWSDLISRIRSAAPDAAITAWCNEDTPLLWAQLIRELSGVDPLTKITGGFDLLAAIMTDDGMRKFLAYLKTHPPQTEGQKRRVIAAFLDRYALPGEVEEEIDAPGWTVELVEDLTRGYEADLEVIASMPGVTLVTP